MAIYPLSVYLFVGNVKDLPQGVYKYIPQGHKMELVCAGDQRVNIGGQPQMQKAPAVFVYVENLAAFGSRFGDRSQRWADLEVGHSAENVLLEEVALGLIGVPMGGIDAAKLKSLLKLQEKEEAVYAVSAAKKGAAVSDSHSGTR
jgi:SagB-type dehydrogenase family enzyme